VSGDYRRFLGRVEERVLAYLGGDTVVDEGRGLRLAAPVAPGWWRFAVAGRTATAVEPAAAPAELLARLPSVTGHWSGWLLVHRSAQAERLELLPEESPARFAPCRARRWWSEDLLFEAVDFEGEAEDGARRAFEDRRPLGELKGAPATLRAAYAYAVFDAAERESGLSASPLELRGLLGAVADEGWPAAERGLRRLQAEREAASARAAARVREAVRVAARQVAREQGRSPVPSAERAERALTVAGGRMLGSRSLADGLMEVSYRFLGERFTSVVVAETLQVLDAGICLANADEELTLESLPGVIREAVETRQLVITRTR
jgi:hypothetical protein